MKRITDYCSRVWVNPEDSAATGSIVCYDGYMDDERISFMEIASMLQVVKQAEVVCSAIGIKEAVTMLPITAWICSAIKDMINHQGHVISIDLSPEQCVAIGKVLGELGFVSEMGENPLDLIREMEYEEE